MRTIRNTVLEIEVILPDNATKRTIKVKEMIHRVQEIRAIMVLGKTITELMQNKYVPTLNSHRKWDRLPR